MKTDIYTSWENHMIGGCSLNHSLEKVHAQKCGMSVHGSWQYHLRPICAELTLCLFCSLPTCPNASPGWKWYRRRGKQSLKVRSDAEQQAEGREWLRINSGMLRRSSWGYDVLAIISQVELPGFIYPKLHTSGEHERQRGNTFTKGKRVVKWKWERDVHHRRRHHWVVPQGDPTTCIC